MSYTRTCTSCPATLTWDEEKNCYVDQIFTNEKHDHAKYKAAVVAIAEGSNEGKTGEPIGEYDKADGQECYTCKARGVPDKLIFFNSAVKGKKSGKVIPLERPDKVNGSFVFHEHVEEGKAKGTFTDKATPQGVTKDDVNTSVKAAAQNDGVDFTQMALNDTIRAFTHQLGTQQKWFEDSRDKIDTILAYVLDHTVKKANE